MGIMDKWKLLNRMVYILVLCRDNGKENGNYYRFLKQATWLCLLSKLSLFLLLPFSSSHAAAVSGRWEQQSPSLLVPGNETRLQPSTLKGNPSADPLLTSVYAPSPEHSASEHCRALQLQRVAQPVARRKATQSRARCLRHLHWLKCNMLHLQTGIPLGDPR